MKRRAAKLQDADLHGRASRPVYPFAAIVGQEEMKLALLLNVIDPAIGGVLMMGHRGTGKSTIVRALADLLPQIAKIRDCLYGCDPADESNHCDECQQRISAGDKLQRMRAPVAVVDLPLGATEDRVCGAINIERALTVGVKAFEPGLLARANRGFLYIDEVNLLEDHLIDILLDVAVTGRNNVEREGMSLEHPSRFVLIGSGNPEEGELRPQLLDRFGLYVEVVTEIDLDKRVEIVEQRESFERDPVSFRASVETEQENLRRRLIRARQKAHQVKLSRELLRRIAELCLQLKIDGHRGELTIARAARALAAFEGRREASASDARRVSRMALQHRLRRDPLEESASSARIEQALEKFFPMDASKTEADRFKHTSDTDEVPPPNHSGGKANRARATASATSLNSPADADGTGDDAVSRDSPPALEAQMAEEILNSQSPQSQQKKSSQFRPGRNQKNARQASYNSLRGRYARAVAASSGGAKVALDATLRAAAQKAGVGCQVSGDGENSFLSDIQHLTPDTHPAPDTRHLTPSKDALRYKQYRRRTGTLFIFAIDASGSMALNRINLAKGVMMRLLQKSYIKRDQVALVSFRRKDAAVILPPSRSVTRAKNTLDALHLGGSTPLSAGLARALEVARRAASEGMRQIVLLLFTDGRANVPLHPDGIYDKASRQKLIAQEVEKLGAALLKMGVITIVIDTQNRFTSSGEGQALANRLRGRYTHLSPRGAASLELS